MAWTAYYGTPVVDRAVRSLAAIPRIGRDVGLRSGKRWDSDRLCFPFPTTTLQCWCRVSLMLDKVIMALYVVRVVSSCPWQVHPRSYAELTMAVKTLVYCCFTPLEPAVASTREKNGKKERWKRGCIGGWEMGKNRTVGSSDRMTGTFGSICLNSRRLTGRPPPPEKPGVLHSPKHQRRDTNLHVPSCPIAFYNSPRRIFLSFEE